MGRAVQDTAGICTLPATLGLQPAIYSSTASRITHWHRHHAWGQLTCYRRPCSPARLSFKLLALLDFSFSSLSASASASTSASLSILASARPAHDSSANDCSIRHCCTQRLVLVRVCHSALAACWRPSSLGLRHPKPPKAPPFGLPLPPSPPAPAHAVLAWGKPPSAKLESRCQCQTSKEISHAFRRSRPSR